MIPSGQSGSHRRQASKNSRGQTETLGIVLLLGLVVAGTTVVVALGGTAVSDTQARSDIERVSNAMTLFDSQSATVALGESAVRTARFGQSSGTFRVDDDAGRLTIVHQNYDGSGTDETIYDASLGSIVYETRDSGTVAYQGGGVWQSNSDGNTVMISPPEFHFRDSTLTLPVIRVAGSGSVSGTVEATIKESVRGVKVYPATSSENANAPYPNGDSFANPIQEGTVAIRVESEYAEGWAEYFETRTDGMVTLSGDTAEVVLESPSLVGDFAMPSEGNGVNVRAMKDTDHPNADFSITLAHDGHFNNMHWSLYADEGTQKLEFHIYADRKCTGGSYDGTIDLSVFYSDETGSYEGWQAEFDPGSTSAVDVDCSAGEMTIDFTSSTGQLKYKQIEMTGNDNKWRFGNEIKAWTHRSETTTFTHPSDTNGQYSTGETASLNQVTNHYLTQVGPEFDMRVTDGPGGSSRVNEDASRGNLDYDTGGSRYITFLHITENEIEVELN